MIYDNPFITKTEYEIAQYFLPKSPEFFLPESFFNSLAFEEFTLKLFENITQKNEIIIDLSPIILSYLKMGLSLYVFHTIFLQLKKKKDFFANISPRNLLEFLLQITEEKHKPKIGFYLVKRCEFIPLTYWRYSYTKQQFLYKIDLSLLFSLKIKENEKIIMNFGFVENCGKTSLLSELFGIPESSLNLNGFGILRQGTIDLYLINDYVILDVHGFCDEKKFVKNMKKLMAFCDGIIMHADIKKNKTKLKQMRAFLDGFEDLFVVFRDSEGENDDFIEKYRENFKEMEYVCLKKLDDLKKNEKKEEFYELNAKFNPWIKKLLPKKKNDGFFNLENLLKFRKEKKNFEKKEANELNNSDFSLEKVLPLSLLDFYKKKKLQKMEKIEELESKILGIQLKHLEFACEYCKTFINGEFKELLVLEKKIKLINIQHQQSKNLKDSLDSFDFLYNKLTFHDLFFEIFLYYEKNSQKLNKTEKKFFKDLKTPFMNYLLNGKNLHFFRGDPPEFENKFLYELFSLNELNENCEYFVISVLGTQSSGKSTLLNFLFGTSFEVGTGRCTRGIYLTIIKTSDPNLRIILLDTEGLSSIETDDKLFDNQMALMCFGVSDLVLINQKGEIAKDIEDLLMVSINAMNYFQKLKDSYAKVFFILRDQKERDFEKQRNSFNKLFNDLCGLSNQKNFLTDEKIGINSEDCVLMPSAYCEITNKNGSFLMINKEFSKEITNLGKKILGWIDEKKGRKFRSLQKFYDKTCDLWKCFKKYGINIMVADSLKEYDVKLEINRVFSSEISQIFEKIKKDLNVFLKERSDFFSENDNFKPFAVKKTEENIKNKIDLLKTYYKNIKDKMGEKYPKEFIENEYRLQMDSMQAFEREIIFDWGNKIESLTKRKRERESEKEGLIIENKVYQKSTILNQTDEIFLPEIFKTCFLQFKTFDYNQFFENFSENEFQNVPINWNFFIKKLENSLNKKPRCFLRNMEKIYESEILEELGSHECTLFISMVINFLNMNDFPFQKTKIFKIFSLHYFIKTISKIIYENKKKQMNKEKNEKIDIENKEKAIYQKNSLFSLINCFKESIEEYLFQKLEEIIERKMKKIGKRLFFDEAKDYLKKAKAESFEKFNLQNVLKYCINPVLFVKEIFQSIANDFQKELNTAIEYKITKLIKKYKKKLFKFLKDRLIKNELITIEMLLTSFYEYFPKCKNKQFFKHLNLKETIEVFNENELFNLIEEKDFFSIKSDFKRNLILKFIKEKEKIALGCTIICPFCHAKCCCSATGNHMFHSAFHLYMRFGGNFCYSGEKRNKFISYQFCLHQKENIGFFKKFKNTALTLMKIQNKQWISHKTQKEFNSLLDLVKEDYYDWFYDFKENANAICNDEKVLQVKNWLLVKKPLLKFYNLLEELEAADEFEKKIIKEIENSADWKNKKIKSLDENYHEPDYNE